MHMMRWVIAYCAIVLSCQASGRNYEADPALYPLMDELPAELISFTGHPSSIYLTRTVAGADHLTIYAPDTRAEVTSRIIAAYQQGGNALNNLFQAHGQEEVKVFVVEQISRPNSRALASRVSGQLVILVQGGDYTGTHSSMNICMLQRMTGAHPYDEGFRVPLANTTGYDEARRWYVEGPPQFAPLITGAPDNWIDKALLYHDGDGSGRFQQAIGQAHGKTMVQRQELASLFWYYYFQQVSGGSTAQLGSAILSYRDQGFKNEEMDWFNFRDYWHNFALAHLNLPGDKTGVWDSIDADFALVDAARDGAEIVQFPDPFGDEVELEPLSQKYFSIESLSESNDYVIFALPDNDIPEGVEISAC